jgi:hypothetical protein
VVGAKSKPQIEPERRVEKQEAGCGVSQSPKPQVEVVSGASSEEGDSGNGVRRIERYIHALSSAKVQQWR